MVGLPVLNIIIKECLAVLKDCDIKGVTALYQHKADCIEGCATVVVASQLSKIGRKKWKLKG